MKLSSTEWSQSQFKKSRSNGSSLSQALRYLFRLLWDAGNLSFASSHELIAPVILMSISSFIFSCWCDSCFELMGSFCLCGQNSYSTEFHSSNMMIIHLLLMGRTYIVSANQNLQGRKTFLLHLPIRSIRSVWYELLLIWAKLYWPLTC